MYIQSRENINIKNFCRLRDKRSARQSEGKFTLEGLRIVLDAVKEGVKLDSAYISTSAKIKYPEAADILESALGSRLFEVSDEVSEKLGGTVAPQGVYAVAPRLDKKLPLDKIVYRGKFLILDNLQDPGNVGTVLRAADAVGVSGVYICGGCDIYNPKLVRSTMGSLFRVPIEDSLSFRDTAELFRRSGIPLYASVVDSDAENLREVRFCESCAVVIGNEGNGLPDEDADLCDHRVTIKMSGTIESLNAAAAAAIILWEMTKPESRE